jgi:hypothetical protein
MAKFSELAEVQAILSRITIVEKAAGLRAWPYVADFGGIQNNGTPFFRYLGVESDSIFDLPGTVTYRDCVSDVIVNRRDGSRQLFDKDTPAIVPHFGLHNWQERNNYVRHGRNLTQADWVKTDCTPSYGGGVVNDLGMDCSRLTATAAGATVKQSAVTGGTIRNNAAQCRLRKESGSGVCRIRIDSANWKVLNLPADGSWLDHTETFVGATGIMDDDAIFELEMQDDADVIDFDEGQQQRTTGVLSVQPFIEQGAGAIGAATKRDGALLTHELLQDGFARYPDVTYIVGFYNQNDAESGTIAEISNGTGDEIIRMNHRADASIYYAQKGETTQTGGAGGTGNDPQKIPQIAQLIDPATGRPCVYGMQPGVLDLMVVSHRLDTENNELIRRVGTSFYIDPATGLPYHEKTFADTTRPNLAPTTFAFANDINDANPFQGSIAFFAARPAFADANDFARYNGGSF